MKFVAKGIAAIVAVVTLLVPSAFAATTPTLNQNINPGTLSMNIMQSDGTTPVDSPTVAFSEVNRNFACQTATATLGDTNNKIYVSNLANNGGFSLTMAATGGAAATWTDSGKTYKYNDPASAGCANGQMTVNPSDGTVTLDCSSSCTSDNVTRGASTSFASGTADSVTLMTRANGSGWRGYLTGVSLSQTIPANQASGTYALGMTMTLTAQ